MATNTKKTLAKSSKAKDTNAKAEHSKARAKTATAKKSAPKVRKLTARMMPGHDITLAADGQMLVEVPLYISLQKFDGSSWVVTYGTDAKLKRVFDMLCKMSPLGASDNVLDVLNGCANADGLTDKQAARVREYFTNWIKAK